MTDSATDLTPPDALELSASGVPDLLASRESVGHDEVGGDLRVWEVASGQEVRWLKHAASLRHVEVSADGRWLFVVPLDAPMELWRRVEDLD